MHTKRPTNAHKETYSQQAAEEREELLTCSREWAAAVSANQALQIELLNAFAWYLKSSVQGLKLQVYVALRL
jgi:hypothetical protein